MVAKIDSENGPIAVFHFIQTEIHSAYKFNQERKVEIATAHSFKSKFSLSCEPRITKAELNDDGWNRLENLTNESKRKKKIWINEK